MLRGTTLFHLRLTAETLEGANTPRCCIGHTRRNLKTFQPRGSETMFGRTTGTPFHLTELSEAAE